MLAKTYSYGIAGLESYPITIEVDVTRGLPATIIVGLPDNAVKESKERVRSAIINSGYEYSPQESPSRKTINLSPADTKKEGPSFDLAMALGILAATEQIPALHLEEYAVLGELSLDGSIQPINGTLSIALAASKDYFKGVILPWANIEEAAIVKDIHFYPIRTLTEAVNFLSDPNSISPYQADSETAFSSPIHNDIDFSDVKGQDYVKRGLEIAAAGGHNCLMIGPPGTGKSMLAKRLPTILPDMNIEECLETTKIHSCMGLLKESKGLMVHRPFRSPHHTTSDVAVVGGGSFPKPGEVTLSHNGVLFLDELPEFNRNVLESLRQPLEDHFVTISRAQRAAQFPSNFMLVASMNPCHCGNFGNPRRVCHCSSMQIQKYRSKISGPLLDRIDIHLEVPPLNYLELSTSHPAETSIQIKGRVNQARSIQLKRFQSHKGILANAQMNHRQIQKYCILGNEESDLLRTAMKELNLSARAHDKILKISRTIADLEGSDDIKIEHLAEAIQYRSLDRDWWA